jgi:hypothetical protein
MNFKDLPILIIFSLFLGVMIFGQSTPDMQVAPEPSQAQTNPPLSVWGRTALFIGDSHTANHQFGWQKILCDRTGMNMKNVSSGGKTTDWMLNQAVYSINDEIDLLFVFGGANDMYSGYMSPSQCLDNLQKIVNVAHARGIRTIVITGFDPNKVVTVHRKGYKERYSELQNLMISSLQNCSVVDCRNEVGLKDCGDGLCHMRKSGHEKIAMKIIDDLGLQILDRPNGRNNP